MTTKLHKAVHRESVKTLIRDGSKYRGLIVSLLPGDVISLRLKGTRRPELLPAAEVWAYAVKLRVLAERTAKQSNRIHLAKRGML